MGTMNKRETGIAVLIDGENVGASFAGKILGALRSLGRIDIGNVYFDLQRGQSVEWIRDLPSLPLEPVVTAVEETGKSGSDISLILDAVEILHTRDIGIFCICSSDGDFTGLARYLKAHGKAVIAAGDGMRTPSSLRVSCDRFIDIGKPESAIISELKSPDPAAPDGRAEDQPCVNDGADARHAADPGQDGAADPEKSAEGTPAPEAHGGGCDACGAGNSGIAEPAHPEEAGDGSGSVQLELSFGGPDEAARNSVPAEPAGLPPETAVGEEQPETLPDRAAAAVREIMDGSEGKGINPTALQQRLRRMIPDFSVRKLGYRRFTDFLAALEAADASPETGDGGQVNPDP